MAKLKLNPRVSVFSHEGGLYLYDPATRTCASINETMLAFVGDLDAAQPLGEAADRPVQGPTQVVEQLRKLGILIVPEVANCDRHTTVDGPGSMTNLAIFVTTKCNLRCAYCYANGGDSGRTIDRDVWRLAMDHFFSTLNCVAAENRSKHRSVGLSIHGGGEATVEFPTLREIVAEFCEYASAAGLQPSICMGTNGTYAEAVHRWILAHNISVNISLDGPPHIQNLQRPFRSGRASYDVVARNLKALVDAGRRVSVRATVTNASLESMEETIELARQLGVSTVHFEPVALTGRCASTVVARPDAERFAARFLACFLLGLELDVEVTYSGMRCFQPLQQKFCAACGQNFCVTPDGNITTCYEVLDLEDPAASAFLIGKVDPIEGRVVLDNLRVERLQQRVAENMKACKGCFLRYQCAGDCPVKSFRYSGRDLYSPDPYRCQIADRINKQLIAWLADGMIECRDPEQAMVVSLNPASH